MEGTLPKPKIKFNSIRSQFDEKTRKWMFSIVDAIGILTETSDPRNYWKVLKNRLKKSQNQLVTKCNQLKMLSRDGKYYLTDVADVETILELAVNIPKANIVLLESCLCPTDEESEDVGLRAQGTGAKLMVDGTQTNTHIFIRAMAAGVAPSDLSVIVNPTQVTIKGSRKHYKEKYKSYEAQELFWGSFSRTLTLPARVKTDNVETIEESGLLTIKLEKF